MQVGLAEGGEGLELKLRVGCGVLGADVPGEPGVRVEVDAGVDPLFDLSERLLERLHMGRDILAQNLLLALEAAFAVEKLR